MDKEIIKQFIFTDFDDMSGPLPLIRYPENLPEKFGVNVSIKTITLLATERGAIPKSLIIIPFPSLNAKGIIKFLKRKDSSRRGGYARSAITFLFEEMNDLIFYKYIQNLELPFNKAVEKIVAALSNEYDLESVKEILLELREDINHILNELKEEELKQENGEEFPEFDEEVEDYSFKFIFCGDQTVGKTSIILRYTDNAFKRTYLPTIGVNITEKSIVAKNAQSKLVLWDIAGQIKFDKMRKYFYQGADGVFLIFDLTNQDSFNNVRKWFNDITASLNINGKVSGFMIGNKKDLAQERVVQFKTAQQLAEELGIQYIETSALTGENVEEAFEFMTDRLINYYRNMK